MQLTQGRGPRPWPRFPVPGSGFGRGMAPRSAFDAEWLRVTRNGSAFKTIVWLLRRDAEFRVPRSALDAEWLRVPLDIQACRHVAEVRVLPIVF